MEQSKAIAEAFDEGNNFPSHYAIKTFYNERKILLFEKDMLYLQLVNLVVE